MDQRDITIQMIQRTKKYGSIKQLQFYAYPEINAMLPEAKKEARIWLKKLSTLWPSREKSIVAENLIPKIKKFRFELHVKHSGVSTLDLKKQLISEGFFDRRGNRILYHDNETGIKLVEGNSDGPGGQVKLITVMCDGDDRNIHVNSSLKSDVLTAEEESDIELISTEHAHFITLGKSVAAVEKASGAKVKFLENAVSGVGRTLTNDKILCHMVGKATERQRAWALIKAVLTVSQDGNELERLIQHQDNDLVAQAAILQNRNAIHFVSAQLRGSVGFNTMMLSSFPFDEALLLVPKPLFADSC